MWEPAASELLPVVGPAAAALLGSVAAQRLSVRPCELWSETICWLVLLGVAKQQQHGAPDSRLARPASPMHYQPRPAASAALWTVALGLVTVAVFRTEFGADGFLPALTPLLLAVEQHLRPATAASRSSPLASTLWGTALVALFASGTLMGWSHRGHVHSLVPVAALLVVYAVLTPRRERSPRWARVLPHLDLEDALLPLASRMVGVLALALGIETYAFGVPRCHVVATLAAGLAKALSWYGLMQTTQQAPWRLATAIGTFSLVSTRDPAMQTSGLQALAFVVASLLSLAQVVHLLPREAKYRSALWLFALVALVPYISNLVTLRHPPSRIHSQEHPVEALMRHAQSGFDAMLQRQSQNYTAARDEYRRRYRVEPPPGFEGWFAFAKAHQSPIIDEFDAIHDSIAPLWAVSGRDIQGVMKRIHDEPNSELWLCTFSGGQGKTHCTHRHRSFDRHLQLLFDTLLGDVRNVLPDVQFLANHIDEPRVLVPPTARRPNYRVATLSRQPVWDTLTQFCPKDGARSTTPQPAVDTHGLPFVTDARSARDLCQHPEYKEMYGLTQSPTSFHLIEGAVPVLTTGALSTMGDLLYPSAAYIEAEFRYDEAADVDWDQKQANLYWAGSTTGGFAVDDGQWRHFQRQRFVGAAQNRGGAHVYLQEDEQAKALRPTTSSFLNGRQFDVAFTRVFQCATAACREQRAHFRTQAWAHKDAALRSRLAFDLDGNGISGRYYKLLASRSCPLKQTLLREWHDDRLVPWVHYVPVSPSLDELPELVAFLASPGRGDRAARTIADQGRAWFGRALREADMAVYTYRLLLELARLQDPERPAGVPAEVPAG